MRKNPTFYQQWILSYAQNNMLYDGHLWTDTFSPFRGGTQSEIKSFLNRMVVGGWLHEPEKNCFWRLTNKTIDWLSKNKLKSRSQYSEERRQKFTSKK
jgi:hypothetical protein